MPPLSICINSQTPLIQFLSPDAALDPPEGIEIADLQEGIDYRFSPGGVTRVVYPLLRRLVRDGVIEEVHWVALNPRGPRRVRFGEITLHNVGLAPRVGWLLRPREGSDLGAGPRYPHGGDHHDDLFWTDAFAEYSYYNRITTELIQRLDGQVDFDAFYIHDFQQLPVGHMLGTLKPKVFRWHIPFDDSAIPVKWRSHLGPYLEQLRPDRRERPQVRRRPSSVPCPRGRSSASTRTSTPRTTRPPTGRRRGTAAAVRSRPRGPRRPRGGADGPDEGPGPGHRGGAGTSRSSRTSSSSSSGTGASRAHGGASASRSREGWRTHLERVIQRGGLERRVVFTGHVSQHELDCLYERCAFTILPSIREGFGLVVVESWLHRKPAIVTRRAGVAELIRPRPRTASCSTRCRATSRAQMRRLLGDRTGRLRESALRSAGRTARLCSVDAAVRSERKILERIAESKMLDPGVIWGSDRTSWPAIIILGTWVVALLVRGLIGQLMGRSHPSCAGRPGGWGRSLVWVVGRHWRSRRSASPPTSSSSSSGCSASRRSSPCENRWRTSARSTSRTSTRPTRSATRSRSVGTRGR